VTEEGKDEVQSQTGHFQVQDLTQDIQLMPPIQEKSSSARDAQKFTSESMEISPRLSLEVPKATPGKLTTQF